MSRYIIIYMRLCGRRPKLGEMLSFSLLFFVQCPRALYYYNNILDGGVAVLVVARNRHHDDGVLDAIYILYICIVICYLYPSLARCCSPLQLYIYIIYKQVYIDSETETERERERARKRW